MTNEALTRERNIFLFGLLALLAFAVASTLLPSLRFLRADEILWARAALGVPIYLTFRLSRFLRQPLWLSIGFTAMVPFQWTVAVPVVGLLISIRKARKSIELASLPAPTADRERLRKEATVDDKSGALVKCPNCGKVSSRTTAYCECGIYLGHVDTMSEDPPDGDSIASPEAKSAAYRLGSVLGVLGVIVWTITAIWVFVLFIRIAYGAAGFWGVLGSIALAPVSFLVLPWYALFAMHDATPFVVMLAGAAAGSLLTTVGSKLRNEHAAPRPPLRPRRAFRFVSFVALVVGVILGVVVLRHILPGALDRRPGAVAPTSAAATHRVFKCREPIPEFTLGPHSNPSDGQVEQLCACIWGHMDGWERETARAIVEGREADVSALNMHAFPARLGKRIRECGGDSL